MIKQELVEIMILLNGAERRFYVEPNETLLHV